MNQSDASGQLTRLVKNKQSGQTTKTYHSVDEPFEFHWPKEPIRALGTFISYYQKQNEGKKL